VRWSNTEISETDLLRSLDNWFCSSQLFLDHLADRDHPLFFLDSISKQLLDEIISDLCPTVERHIIMVADQVCDHIFELLGSGPIYLGKQIDWHLDFKTGHRFDPDKYYADVRPAPYPGGYDIKVPWELSRCQHFVWIGQAYWFTEDEKYAQEFVVQVLDWIEKNPPQFGVNWACTMDVAIRVVNWLWGYYFFKDSPSLEEGFLLTFFKSLLIHGRHIFRNLENQGDFTGNHYLSNLVGLIYLGILCPEFEEARRWREFGLQEIEKEMFKQVFPDGVDFEASTSYHRLVTEMFLSIVILAQLNGHEFSELFMDRLEKMVEFVMYITKPDGTVPLIGDNDNGRLHRLKVWNTPQQEWVDFRYLLAIGSVLFERKDFALAAGNQWEEAIWLLGARAVNFRQVVAGENLTALTLESREFVDAGVYVMRNEDYCMIVDAGLVGQQGKGGHAHNDMLSFEMYAKAPWIIDPGMPTYTGDYGLRNAFRSTNHHNTVMLDAQEQNRFVREQSFLLHNDTDVRVLRWDTSSSHDVLRVEHYGYERLKNSVIHCRTYAFNKLRKQWRITDSLQGKGVCDASWHFWLNPECYVEDIDSEGGIVRIGLGNELVLVLNISSEKRELTFGVANDIISPCYGGMIKGSVIKIRSQIELPFQMSFNIVLE